MMKNNTISEGRWSGSRLSTSSRSCLFAEVMKPDLLTQFHRVIVIAPQGERHYDRLPATERGGNERKGDVSSPNVNHIKMRVIIGTGDLDVESNRDRRCFIKSSNKVTVLRFQASRVWSYKTWPALRFILTLCRRLQCRDTFYLHKTTKNPLFTCKRIFLNLVFKQN